MGKRIAMKTRKELLKVIRKRYGDASRLEKSRILDEFVKITGYHRKHAIRLLNDSGGDREMRVKAGRRIYKEAVRQALIVIWEAADRICGKRLKAISPIFIESMERHGHLCLDEEVRMQLMKVSASTIDRILAPIRAPSKKRKNRSANPLVKSRIPVRTFSDWNDPEPGYFEGDLVAHCGGSVSGNLIHTFVLTDIASGWTDFVPLIAKEQTVVVEALDIFRKQLPMKLKGLDTDNDSVFINDKVIKYCDLNKIEFTRSRSHRKNDQAWIEQKNGAVIRRIVGYGRFEGIAVAREFSRLYRAARLYVNYFQPSFKLRSKARDGAKVRKTYDAPATPCSRILSHPKVSSHIKRRLRKQRDSLDPVKLLKELRDAQEVIAGMELKEGETENLIHKRSLDNFLSSLPELWKYGEVRPTHRKKPRPPHTWRTRVNPYEVVWPQVLEWLAKEPDVTAKVIFERLREQDLGEFLPGQLRTLQRRVREWRQAMAKKLIFLSCEPNWEKKSIPTCDQYLSASELL